MQTLVLDRRVCPARYYFVFAESFPHAKQLVQEGLGLECSGVVAALFMAENLYAENITYLENARDSTPPTHPSVESRAIKAIPVACSTGGTRC